VSTDLIRLVPAVSTQRGAMIDLWVAAWTAAMPQIDFDARRPWFAARLEELAASGALTTCAVDARDALLGFVIVDPVSGELDQLCVAEKAQGSGLASRLMAQARRHSPNGLSLSVNLDNARALRFYEREGFRRGEEGRNPLSGLPTLRMFWRPTPQP
jgi:putative acetyltransferase